MGVWGTGLYSGDFAKDLSSAARAVSLLPFDGDRLADLLCTVEPGAANNRADEDHTTFWLVVADQFAKRGIVSERARTRALEIIDGEEDLAMLVTLGMDAAGLGKRRKMLTELREKIVSTIAPAKPRRVLKKPQTMVMNTGDVAVYPTMRGSVINPYFPSVEKMRPVWHQDGWAGVVIVETGRAFDFLAWYRPLTSANAVSAKPQMQEILANPMWHLKRPGTCSASHFKKMRLEKLGTVSIDQKKLDRCFPNRRSGVYCAVNDISIANGLGVGPVRTESIDLEDVTPNQKTGNRVQGIRRLDEILG